MWSASSQTAASGTDAQPKEFRTYQLDQDAITALLAQAPRERTAAAESAPLVLSLPGPAGFPQRFALQDSPIMQAGLARAHPEIRTYSGRGLDDPAATIRADVSPLGFHASIRSPKGNWYIDPSSKANDDAYIVYYTRDLPADPDGPFEFKEGDDEALAAAAVELSTNGGGPSAGDVLRTYRLALVTDQSYSTYFGGPANVTAAKVALMNRVNQVYEDETSIRLVLINDTDKTNLNTDADAIGANGPCGSAPCFTAAQLAGCGGGTLGRNRIVLGQIVGASNYDIGHLGLGKNGGGVANLGVVGGNAKAGGCTGLPNPEGDFYAVDYVAHEMGHQFAGNHTFNGTQLELLGRQPQRRHVGRAGQRLVDHGVRRHLPSGRHPAAQRPVLVAAELRGDHDLRHLGAAADQRGADGLAARLRRHRLVQARARRRPVGDDHERHQLLGRRDPGSPSRASRRSRRSRSSATTAPTRTRSSTRAPPRSRSSAARTTPRPGSRTRSRAATSSSRPC